MYTFRTIFNVFQRQFPPALVSKDWRERLSATVGDLPDALSAGFVLECRLDAQPQVDLGVVVDPRFDQGREVLAGGQSPGSLLSDAVRDHPVWRSVGAFCQQWQAPESPLHQSVETIWLEFDITPEETPLVPVPSFFFGLTSEAWRRAAQGTASDRFDWLLAGLTGFRALPAAAHARLRGALATLPASAEVFQIGLMLPRPSDHIRVCVRGRSDPALADYLASLGWPGDAPALRELIATLGGLVDTIALDMDVSDGIAPRLGIECRFEGWRQPAHEPRWTPFLNWLVERQLCTPDKREALLAWPQIGYHRFPDERAPRGLIRALNHIKLVVVPGQPLAAKGYLWFGHRTAAFIRSLR